MCLSIAIHRPEDVLARGNHAGHDWVVVHNGIGYRCGYVKVEPGHPWHGADENDLACDVTIHGALTFAEHDIECGKPGAQDSGWWLGFDCAHAGDARDPSLPFNRILLSFGDRGEIRSQEYVEAECRGLCEQAAAARKTVLIP